VLVHSRDRILPELSESLASYALEHMRARGVTFKLEARVTDARRGMVVLNPPEEVPTETLVWTAGTRPNPLFGTLGVDNDPRGAVVVGATLAVPGQPGVWALGDCAAVPDTKTGRACAPTAQFAIREAATLEADSAAGAAAHSAAARPLEVSWKYLHIIRQIEQSAGAAVLLEATFWPAKIRTAYIAHKQCVPAKKYRRLRAARWVYHQ
jgi:NADH dehydrogenase